jgi:hypothetical protein
MKHFTKSEKGYYGFFYPAPNHREPLPDDVALLKKLDYSGSRNQQAYLISEEDARKLGLRYSVIWINKE